MAFWPDNASRLDLTSSSSRLYLEPVPTHHPNSSYDRDHPWSGDSRVDSLDGIDEAVHEEHLSRVVDNNSHDWAPNDRQSIGNSSAAVLG